MCFYSVAFKRSTNGRFSLCLRLILTWPGLALKLGLYVPFAPLFLGSGYCNGGYCGWILQCQVILILGRWKVTFLNLFLACCCLIPPVLSLRTSIWYFASGNWLSGSFLYLDAKMPNLFILDTLSLCTLVFVTSGCSYTWSHVLYVDHALGCYNAKFFLRLLAPNFTLVGMWELTTICFALPKLAALCRVGSHLSRLDFMLKEFWIFC